MNRLPRSNRQHREFATNLNTKMNEESMETMTAPELIEKPGLLNLRHRQRTRG